MKQLFGNDQMKPTPITHGKSLYGFSEEMRTLYEKKLNLRAELEEENKKQHNLRRQVMLPERELNPDIAAKLRQIRERNTLSVRLKKEDMENQEKIEELKKKGWMNRKEFDAYLAKRVDEHIDEIERTESETTWESSGLDTQEQNFDPVKQSFEDTMETGAEYYTHTPETEENENKFFPKFYYNDDEKLVYNKDGLKLNESTGEEILTDDVLDEIEFQKDPEAYTG